MGIKCPFSVEWYIVSLFGFCYISQQQIVIAYDIFFHGVAIGQKINKN